MNIKECKELAEDMPVLDLAVTVQNIGKRRTGTGDYGEWSFQDIYIQDQTGAMWVKCQNKDPLDSLQGKNVELTCYKSEKRGWTGLTTIDDEYEGKVIRKLKMTKTGVIKIVEEQEEQPEEQHQPEKKYDYFEKRYELDKQKLQYDIEKQTIICRQNALTNAIAVLTSEGRVTTAESDEIIALAEIFTGWTRFGVKPKQEEKSLPEPF